MCRGICAFASRSSFRVFYWSAFSRIQRDLTLPEESRNQNFHLRLSKNHMWIYIGNAFPFVILCNNVTFSREFQFPAQLLRSLLASPVTDTDVQHHFQTKTILIATTSLNGSLLLLPSATRSTNISISSTRLIPALVSSFVPSNT